MQCVANLHNFFVKIEINIFARIFISHLGCYLPTGLSKAIMEFVPTYYSQNFKIIQPFQLSVKVRNIVFPNQ